MSNSSDLGRIEELGRQLSDLNLAPQDEAALRQLIELARQLAATITAQEGQIAGLAGQIAALAAQIARMQRELYGSRSEKGKGSNAASDSKDGSATGRKRTRPGGKPGRRKDRGNAVNDTGLRYGPDAVVIDIDIMPPEVEGLAEDEYEIISERVCSKVAAVPVRHAVIRYHYRKVRLKRTGDLLSAPAREGVFMNSCADVSFVANMLVDKFAWHLPLHRQHQRLAESGIIISRRAMSDWANRAIALLEPIHEAQLQSVLQSDVIIMDETPVRAGRNPDRPGKMKTGYYWPVLGDRGEAVFPFARSREHRHVGRILGEFEGTLVSDGYGAYEAYVAIRRETVKQQGCWTHTRRKFEEQLASHPQLAAEALALIAPIHAIEDEIDGEPPGVRLKARRSRTRPVVDAFWVWCKERQEDPALTPKHPITGAVGYATARRDTLEVFLDDPDVPVDSNGVERQLRGIKLGQKNWLFSWTEIGARNVGIANSFITTCRMQGIDPCIWLTDVLIRIDTHPGGRASELTPRRWAELFADNPMTSDVAGMWRHATSGNT